MVSIDEDREQSSLLPGIKARAQEHIVTGVTALGAVGVSALAHNGTVLVVGGLLAYAVKEFDVQERLVGYFQPTDAAQVQEVTERIVARVAPPVDEQLDQRASAKFKRIVSFGRWGAAPAQTSEEEEEPFEDEQADEVQEEENIFTAGNAPVPLPCRRVTMAEIVRNIARNSYMVCLGRSVTDARHLAICVSVAKTHIKLIGASQKGKSSMAASILESLIATHDPHILQIAVLDKEDQTGKLFSDDLHIATFQLETGERVRMHARNDDQVLLHLQLMVRMMDYRYSMSRTQVAEQPLIVVYVEEFLSLKDTFKKRVEWTKDSEKKKRAESDYASLVFCINELARRGLKARIQLLLCAQVDYRDTDLVEAMANITAGLCFCVKPDAARAAGFVDSEMLARNRAANVPGQAVAEFPTCKDIVLAPDFDLEQRLMAWEKQHEHTGVERMEDIPLSTSRTASPSMSGSSGGEAAMKRAEVVEVAVPPSGLSEREMAVLQMVEVGATQKEIILKLWGATGGDKYVRASQELQTIIRKLVTRR